MVVRYTKETDSSEASQNCNISEVSMCWLMQENGWFLDEITTREWFCNPESCIKSWSNYTLFIRILLKNFILISNKYFSTEFNTGKGVILYWSWVNIVIVIIAITQIFSPCGFLQFHAFSSVVFLCFFSS